MKVSAVAKHFFIFETMCSFQWTISDFVYRKNPKLSQKESETIWLVLYNCLSELCVDIRPPVRKSACQTLLQTIAAHGLALKPDTWKHMVWKVLEYYSLMFFEFEFEVHCFLFLLCKF